MAEQIFPSTSSTITDNSFASVIVNSGTDLLQVFLADKGEDNKLLYWASAQDYINEYGEPNIKRYGQTNLNIVRWLKQGGAMWGMRVSPEDALYSHSLITVGIKTQDSIAVPGTKELCVKPVSLSIETGLSDKSGITAGFAAVPATDVEGFKLFPLFAVVGKGRTDEYNKYGLRLSINDSMDATYSDFRLYNASVVEIVNGREKVIENGGPFLVSLAPDAITDAGEPLFISKVFKKYCPEVSLFFNEAAYEDLGETLGVNPDLIDITSPSLQDFTNAPDFWTAAGYSKVTWAAATTDPAPTFEQTNDAKFVEFRKAVMLTGGSKGDITKANQIALKVKAYGGLVDAGITDKNFYPAEIMLDSNEDFAVKSAMANLTKMRGDHVCILDCGTTASPEAAVALRDDKLAIDSYLVSIFAQDFEVYDEFSKTNQRVTTTYDLAGKIPVHDATYGVHRPFVGPRRGGIDVAFENISWYPTDAQKTKLYKRQVNYIEKSPRRINYATQLTSQTATSKLSDLSIVRMVLAIRRISEEVADDFRMEFIDASTMSDLQRQVYDNISFYITNGGCESISVDVSATAYDKTQKRCKVAISLVPTSIMERILIDISVNK